MMQSEFSLNFKDANGRRPYLPHDHRHTGYRPTRGSVASTLGQYNPGKVRVHDEVVDKVIEIGIRFGLDVHTVPILQSHLSMALATATAAEAIDMLRPSDIENLTEKKAKVTEEADRRQIGYVNTSVNTVEQIRHLTESMALTHHIRWIIHDPVNHTVNGLTRALARSRLSLEDLTGENRVRLEEKISDMERMISGD